MGKFKVKRSILAGTSGHRKALKLNRSMDNSNLPDGRSKSSAFTKPEDRLISDVTTMDDPTVTTTVDPNKKGGETTTTTTKQTGKRTRTFEKEQVDAFRQACYDSNGNFLKGKVINGILCELGGSKDDETYKKVDPIEKSDVDVKETGKKMCQCPSQQSYYGVKVGQMMTYPCDGPKHKACSKEPETTINDCECRIVKGVRKGEMIKHPCGSPHELCQDSPSMKDCRNKPGYARAKKRCEEGTKQNRPGKWDDHYCYCDRKPRIITQIKEGTGKLMEMCPKPKRRFKLFGGKKKFIGCEGVDGGRGPKGGGRTM